MNSANCPVPSGAYAYQNEINGTLVPCPVTVGETIQTKPGDNSGPTAQGLNARITNWQTVNQIVQFNADGTATVLQPDSPQLVLIPVLTNPSGQSVWPSGTSSPMTVVGFAYFVITSCGDPNGAARVMAHHAINAHLPERTRRRTTPPVTPPGSP